MLARMVGGAERWSLLPLRIAIGAVFIAHGGQKLFVYGIPGFAGSLTRLGIEPAIFWATVVTAVEFLGGIALLIGLFTRWAALLLAINMGVAIVTVHLPRGFFAGQGGYEFPLVLLGGCVTLLLAGAKKPAVDRS